jgi:hypothetical protein
MDNPSLQLAEQPPALTEAYHKARRSYVLFSALLIAWELIGFEVPEVPLENIKVAVKSPQAIPFVLLVLIGYFGLRTIQEWFQCDAERRKNKWALSDLLSANCIAATAFFVYLTQRLLEVRLAEEISLNVFFVSVIAAFAGLSLPALLTSWKTIPLGEKIVGITNIVVFAVLCYSSLILSGIPSLIHALSVGIMFTLGIILVAAQNYLIRR